MNSRLRAMLTVVGTLVLGGVGWMLTTPQPSTRTMLELADAGILEGQKFVLVCPERLTGPTIRRIRRLQPDALRPKQRYGSVARVAVCFREDGGNTNCIRADGGTAPGLLDGEATVIVPSLRRDVLGFDLDAGETFDDGGESSDIDDALQYQLDGCNAYACLQWDDLVTAGAMPNPYANRFCAMLNRAALVPSACMVPNCWVGDGGAWVDDAVVDCRWSGPFGLQDGGPRYRGCNTGPREWASGAACLPSSCSVVAGDNPFTDL